MCGMVGVCAWTEYFLAAVMTPSTQPPAGKFCGFCTWKFKSILPGGPHKWRCFVMWNGTWSLDCLWLHMVQLKQMSRRCCRCNSRCSCMICLPWKWDLLPPPSDFPPLWVSAFPIFPGAAGWQFMPPSFWMCWSRQGSEYTFVMMLLYLSLWHSRLFPLLFVGFPLLTVSVWLESSDPVRMLSTPDVVFPLSYPLTIFSQWKIHDPSCITQVA